MDTFWAVILALWAQPLALVLTLVAALFAITAVRPNTRHRHRVFMAVIAVISGATVWVLTTGWRWSR